jgi:hypothetical protein
VNATRRQLKPHREWERGKEVILGRHIVKYFGGIPPKIFGNLIVGKRLNARPGLAAEAARKHRDERGDFRGQFVRVRQSLPVAST